MDIDQMQQDGAQEAQPRTAAEGSEPLDVERLARWLHKDIHNQSEGTFGDAECDCRTMAAFYASQTKKP